MLKRIIYIPRIIHILTTVFARYGMVSYILIVHVTEKIYPVVVGNRQMFLQQSSNASRPLQVEVTSAVHCRVVSMPLCFAAAALVAVTGEALSVRICQQIVGIIQHGAVLYKTV